MDSLSSVERRDQTYVARARAPLIKSAVTCAESQRDRHIRMCDGVLPTLFFFSSFFLISIRARFDGELLSPSGRALSDC